MWNQDMDMIGEYTGIPEHRTAILEWLKKIKDIGYAGIPTNLLDAGNRLYILGDPTGSLSLDGAGQLVLPKVFYSFHSAVKAYRKTKWPVAGEVVGGLPDFPANMSLVLVHPNRVNWIAVVDGMVFVPHTGAGAAISWEIEPSDKQKAYIKNWIAGLNLFKDYELIEIYFHKGSSPDGAALYLAGKPTHYKNDAVLTIEQKFVKILKTEKIKDNPFTRPTALYNKQSGGWYILDGDKLHVPITAFNVHFKIFYGVNPLKATPTYASVKKDLGKVVKSPLEDDAKKRAKKWGSFFETAIKDNVEAWVDSHEGGAYAVGVKCNYMAGKGWHFQVLEKYREPFNGSGPSFPKNRPYGGSFNLSVKEKEEGYSFLDKLPSLNAGSDGQYYACILIRNDEEYTLYTIDGVKVADLVEPSEVASIMAYSSTVELVWEKIYKYIENAGGMTGVAKNVLKKNA